MYRVWALAASSWLIVFALAADNIHAEELELKPFATDGCSDFPDGTLEQKDLWLTCCIRHDLAYWLGGSAAARQSGSWPMNNWNPVLPMSDNRK